jgi:choice-of-anchor A domain-containing protein
MDRLLRQLGTSRTARLTSNAKPTLELLEDRVQLDAAPLGTAAPFALLAVNGGSLTVTGNSNVSGDIGVGARASAQFRQADVDGTLFVDPNADRNTPRVGRRSDISGGVVIKDLSSAVQDANAASLADAALAPTLVLGRVTRSMTLVGNGGTNVIQLRSLDYNRDTLTLQGGASDTFVFNVDGDFDFARSRIVLTGGLTASRVLFNFEGRGPEINLSHESSVLNGTFLAPMRSVDSDDVGLFNGSIIARNISISGDMDMVGTPFSLPMGQLASLSGSATLLFQDGTVMGPMENVEITLLNSQGEVVAVAFTDANGNFQFTGLAEGTYTLLGTGVQATPGTVNGSPSGVGGEDFIAEIVLGPGQVGVNYNFSDYFNPG